MAERDRDDVIGIARRLRDLVEPLAANVYFAPQVHVAFADIGFDPSGVEREGVQFPDPTAYFTSRGACLGEVPGEVVVAAFGVFNPTVVLPAVARGWTIARRADVLAARQRGAVASLSRLLDEGPGVPRATELLRRAAEAGRPEGRALFSGLSSLGYPGDRVGDLWRAADLVREHRGDSHILAWASRDLDGCEISLMTDPWRGLPMKTYARTRGWSVDDLDAACERLSARGLMDAEGLAPTGRRLRDEIEVATDLQERSLVEALGEDADELLSLLRPWSEAIVAAHGYPRFSPISARPAG